MAYSIFAKECFRRLQDRRAVDLGIYQVEVDRAYRMLETCMKPPDPESIYLWNEQRHKLLDFWRVERERAYIAGLKVHANRGRVQPSEKRSRDQDEEGVEPNLKRRRMRLSKITAFQPACIQRDYRRHQPIPSFPQTVYASKELENSPGASFRQGGLETLRLVRSYQYIQDGNVQRLWQDKIDSLCKHPKASNVAKIRAELLRTRGKVRKALPKRRPILCWRTDNRIFTEMKRKSKQGEYCSVPSELCHKDDIPAIRRIYSANQASKPGTLQSWIILDEQDTRRFKILSCLSNYEWLDLTTIDYVIQQISSETSADQLLSRLDGLETEGSLHRGEPEASVDTGIDDRLIETSPLDVSSSDHVNSWITKTPRAQVSLREAMLYFRRRNIVSRTFSNECTKYLHNRIHKERAFNQDLLSSTEMFLGFVRKGKKEIL